MTTSVEFRDTQGSLSETLSQVAETLPPETVTVRELLALIGEQGMLFFCIIMTIPFLTPIPLPGVSTVFGALIMLIALGVIANRVPWLPGPLLNRTISSPQLAKVMQSGSDLFRRIEVLIRPRLHALTKDATTNRLNGVVLFLAGFLLIIPIPFIPLSNMIPGYAVLFLAAGMLQRDGVFVLLGYLLVLVTIIYFGAIAVGVVVGGQSLAILFQEPTTIPTLVPTISP